MKFKLLGKEIEISEGRKNYMKILTDYKAMATQAEKDFKQEYNDVFGMVFLNSTWAEKFKKTYGSDGYMDNIVKRYVKKTRQYLANYGVYNLSESTIWDSGIIAEDRERSRLQYEFDLFIIECVSLDEDDDCFISRLKSKFSGSYLTSCLYNDVMSLCDFVLRYLADNKIAEIEFVYKKDCCEAEAIYKNLLDCNISASERERLAYSMIELDPRSKLYYEYIFTKLPKAKYEIAAIASYLSIDISELIDKDIKTSFDLNSISTEEDAVEMMNALINTMKEYGLSDSVRKQELQKILNDFDVKARTYDGVLYETRELRAQAEMEDGEIKSLCGDVSVLEKEACKELIAKVSAQNYLKEVKEKHLSILREQILEIDKKNLENLLLELASKTEDECNQIKKEIYAYDTSEGVKTPYIEAVEARIRSIWDAEDFARFSELYVQTSVSDAGEIAKIASLIEKEGRTATKTLFWKALMFLNENEVQSAAKYAVAKEGGAFASLLNLGKKEGYEILTLNGRVMHPDILSAMEAIKQKKQSGFLSGIFRNKGTVSATQPVPASQEQINAQATISKFCSECGTKLDGDVKFCSNCGNKII